MGCHTWFYRNKKEFEDEILDCEYHDLFRIDGYPETILTSLEETLTYIRDNNCTTFDFTEYKLKLFWEKYPEGKIEFG